MLLYVPQEGALALHFTGTLRLEQTRFKVPVTNWGSLPLALEQGEVEVHNEEVIVIGECGSLW